MIEKENKKMKRIKSIDKEDLCYEEPVEEIGLCDFVPSNPIPLFNFENNSGPSNEIMQKQSIVENILEVSSNFSSSNIFLKKTVLKVKRFTYKIIFIFH
jgi:hypothetical protein